MKAVAFSALWIVVVLLFAWNEQATKKTALSRSCAASHAALAAIQLVPYKLRASELKAVIPTIKLLHAIDVAFYETSDPPRTTDNFTLAQEGPLTFAGETNWVGYRMTFESASDVNVACLMTMNSFTFV